MSASARVLDDTTNLAVVQLSGRHYPGSVIQGDSLIALARDIRSALARTREAGLEIDDLVVAEALLSERLSHYLTVIRREGIKSPAPVDWFVDR
ncbi:MAG: hypothetical protein IT431_15990 [Phycisphaerales bacterium]|nr:hypothetical protein [Phycisphaerales bacterium]